MTKIVYNNCHGGFSLSRAAVLRAREISGDPTWGGPTIKGDTYGDGKPVNRDYGFVKIARHDAVLVQVVEELGGAAAGHLAYLAIAEVPSGGRYKIDEYDGWESVTQPDDEDWLVAP